MSDYGGSDDFDDFDEIDEEFNEFEEYEDFEVHEESEGVVSDIEPTVELEANRRRKLSMSDTRTFGLNYKREEEPYEGIEVITKDIIRNAENVRTTPYLTLYERTQAIGLRAEELYHQLKISGFNPYIDITEDLLTEDGELNLIKIAERELEQKKLPYKIKRMLPNNKYVVVDIQDLIIKDSY